MACPKKDKRDRLPSINPFFHFLKKMWKKYRGCKKSAVVEMAAKKWQCMSRCEKQTYYNAACKAQRLHRKLKRLSQQQKALKQKSKCAKSKAKAAKKSQKNQKTQKKQQVCCPPCPPCPK